MDEKINSDIKHITQHASAKMSDIQAATLDYLNRLDEIMQELARDTAFALPASVASFNIRQFRFGLEQSQKLTSMLEHRPS